MQSDQQRKTDTYQKIQLGGLIAMVGLRDMDKAVLVGMLLDAQAKLGDPAELARFKSLGDAAFRAKQ